MYFRSKLQQNMVQIDEGNCYGLEHDTVVRYTLLKTDLKCNICTKVC